MRSSSGDTPIDHEAKVRETEQLLKNYTMWISNFKGLSAFKIEIGEKAGEEAELAYKRWDFVRQYEAYLSQYSMNKH